MRYPWRMTPPSPHPATPGPSPSDPVGDVLDRWPQTIAVFLTHRMACPGCPVARFQTVAEAAASYGLDVGLLLDACAQAIAAPSPAPHGTGLSQTNLLWRNDPAPSRGHSGAGTTHTKPHRFGDPE
ncbi:hybrid cluster-associated redox disulfide protein [Azospirillum fermentarium]|uniref:DUF1858 domain-containing protein n=1 Tax=Azospirillum fermentarium TaxID=1233114 RepID=UPI002226C3D0|nr:DUF1858 domain-containing protein [Azospirillum fermentarium]MCW2248605.1 hybrid cluster-associated redox disulfide protein [Azospirillum fermentarium]